MKQKSKNNFLPFLAEKSANILHTHYLLKIFAEHIVLVFSIIYLYKNGLEAWQAFLVLAAILLFRLVSRPIGLLLSFKNGLRKTIIIGTLSYAGLFQVLYLVNGFNVWLFIYALYAAFNDTIYWLPFHTYYALMGQEKNRGKHLGTREAFVSLGSILSPILGSFLIVSYGFFALFVVASLLMIIAAIPMLKMPDFPIEKIAVKKALKNVSKKGFWLFIGDGIYAIGVAFVWPFIIFLIFHDYIVYGWLLTIAMFLQSAGLTFLGNMIDEGHGKLISIIAQPLAILVLIGRAAFAYTVPVIILFDFFYAVVNSFYLPAILTVLYNSSRNSSNALWYQFFAESGWDIGAFMMACITALALYFDIGIRVALVFAVIGPIIVGLVSKRHFDSNAN